jgi:hypothetical protein
MALKPSTEQLANKIFRARVRDALLKGAAPTDYSWELVEELEQAIPAVRQAVSAWYARGLRR